LQKFTCGVKHNFDTGVIIKNDDRTSYEWNCSTCELKGKSLSKEDLEIYKAGKKVLCPILTYE
jgi:hypothetical protein